MFFGSTLLALTGLAGLVLAADSIPWSLIVEEEWRPLDDPDADGLPVALRDLPPHREAVFASTTHPRLLLVRAVDGCDTVFDAFMADEERLNKKGKFIPVDDRAVKLGGREAVVFDCNWELNDLVARVSALYATSADDTVHALWIVTTGDTPFRKLESELTSTWRRSLKASEPEARDTYSGVLLGHDVSFSLRLSPSGTRGSSRDRVQLLPAAVPRDADKEFIDSITKANPKFATGILRSWADEKRGVSLSYQAIATDLNLGPKEAFVVWMAGVFQELRRGDPEKGDIPIELVHIDGARTNVVDDETVRKHYENNERAPEAGVILKVYLPRSPFANACELRWTEGEGENLEHCWVRFVELRDYRRSRSETITRSCVMILLARATDAASLALVEEGLDLTTLPTPWEAGFPVPR